MAAPTTWKPLSARSVVMSLLLGAHPEPMTAREVVVAGEHLGLSAATTRVALTRAVASGDLERSGSSYRLGERLLARRRRQEQHASRVAWDGSWEMVVVVGSGRSAADRAAMRTALASARLAELREGVWLRPANLARPLEVGGPEVVRSFTAGPVDDPHELAGALWDLGGWAEQARGLVDLLGGTSDPAERLAVAAQLVRHLSTDPLLPPELWPPGWPERQARAASTAYEREMRAISRR